MSSVSEQRPHKTSRVGKINARDVCLMRAFRHYLSERNFCVALQPAPCSSEPGSCVITEQAHVARRRNRHMIRHEEDFG